MSSGRDHEALLNWNHPTFMFVMCPPPYHGHTRAPIATGRWTQWLPVGDGTPESAAWLMRKSLRRKSFVCGERLRKCVYKHKNAYRNNMVFPTLTRDEGMLSVLWKNIRALRKNNTIRITKNENLLVRITSYHVLNLRRNRR